MNRKSCSCACRTFVLGAATLVIPICLAPAPPYSDANQPEYSNFDKEWAILSNDIFFGGVDALFGLSPASRTLLLSAASDSKTTSAKNAIVTEAQSDDLFSFASPVGSPISSSASGRFAPNAVTAIKQFDGATGGNADPATGASTSWSTAEAWRLDGVPTASDDVLFDNAWRTPLQNVQLGGANRAANSITLSLTNNQTWS